MPAVQRKTLGSDGAARLEAIHLFAGLSPAQRQMLARSATVVVTTPLRGVVLTSHFMHHVREQMPDIAEAIDRAAGEHRERDRLRLAAELAD
jgi:hypothetical protein